MTGKYQPLLHHENMIKYKLIRVLHPLKHPIKEKEMEPMFVWNGKEHASDSSSPFWSELSGKPRPEEQPQDKSLYLFRWVEPGEEWDIEDNAAAVEIWDMKEKGKYSIVYYKMDGADHRILIKASDKTIDEIVPKGTYCKGYTVSIDV